MYYNIDAETTELCRSEDILIYDKDIYTHVYIHTYLSCQETILNFITFTYVLSNDIEYCRLKSNPFYLC